MTLRLYNTLSRTKEEFVPLDPKHVRMYVCGPTVYDFAHIGNARPVIVFDVLFRLLRHLYGDAHVTYVRNITDVEDKINARAAEEGISIRELTERTAKQFHEDVAALGCLAPTHEPRATDHIAAMIAMNERLIAAGHAYVAEGHVLYDVSSKPDYGKLARRSLDEMIAGARVEVAPYKKNPMDFVLWKPSTPEQPGWDSPWGRGRPGWHIECSAMSEALLGETFDIHGGGIDLVFPHHENEIAQSEGAHHGHPLAKRVDAQRLPSGRRREDVQEPGEFLHHPRSSEGLAGRGAALQYAADPLPAADGLDRQKVSKESSGHILGRWYERIKDRCGSPRIGDGFLAALLDDLNTPQAITELHQGSDGNELAGGLALFGLLGGSEDSIACEAAAAGYEKAFIERAK